MINKEQLLDSAGRPLTQSLFLEIGYTDYSVYTLKDNDYEYNGKMFPSLKKIYIESEDPTEYDFANEHLLGWQHWIRLGENKQIRKHIDEWREELEYRLRSKAVKQMMNSAKSGNYQAAKWFIDRGWATRGAGRPSRAEVDGAKEIEARIKNDFSDDVVRMFSSQGK